MASVSSRAALALLTLGVPAATRAQADSLARARECASCAEWNVPHAPFRVFGNTYYVGTNALSSVLVTSGAGHVLIDGALPESAELIMRNIRALGFRVEDVKLILNSHAHFDHAGGLAALQAASGAEVAASPASAREIERGAGTRDDPQYGILLAYPPVRHVRLLHDGEVVHVGSLALTAHFTGGHTAGGTSWTWQSCEGNDCADVVYLDSFTPVSAPGFKFTTSRDYPAALADFEKSFHFAETVHCDVLLSPHPGASDLWTRLAARDSARAKDLRSPGGCSAYAARGREALARRVADEREQLNVRIVHPPAADAVGVPAMIASLARADVVFVGEQHDDVETHRVEEELLEAIGSLGRPVILSLEMFERDVQAVVNAYLAGQLSEDDFLARSRPWPGYANSYRPLVELARARHWPVIAANVPRPLASSIGRAGLAALDKLDANERRWAARENACPMDDYHARFLESMQGHSAGGAASATGDTLPSAVAERFYLAQCVKDETMAESIVAARQAAPPDAIVVHYDGAFHSDYFQGTVMRVHRREPSWKLSVITAVPVTAPMIAPVASHAGQADFILFTRHADH